MTSDHDRVMRSTVFVSGHLLRRTARKSERKLEGEDPGNQYRIVKMGMGRWRYQVRRVIR